MGLRLEALGETAADVLPHVLREDVVGSGLAGEADRTKAPPGTQAADGRILLESREASRLMMWNHERRALAEERAPPRGHSFESLQDWQRLIRR